MAGACECSWGAVPCISCMQLLLRSVLRLPAQCVSLCATRAPRRRQAGRQRHRYDFMIIVRLTALPNLCDLVLDNVSPTSLDALAAGSPRLTALSVALTHGGCRNSAVRAFPAASLAALAGLQQLSLRMLLGNRHISTIARLAALARLELAIDAPTPTPPPPPPPRPHVTATTRNQVVTRPAAARTSVRGPLSTLCAGAPSAPRRCCKACCACATCSCARATASAARSSQRWTLRSSSPVRHWMRRAADARAGPAAACTAGAGRYVGAAHPGGAPPAGAGGSRAHALCPKHNVAAGPRPVLAAAAAAGRHEPAAAAGAAGRVP